jgi:hypothetical protein
MEADLSHRTLLRHDEVMAASMAARRRSISANWVLALLMVGLIAAVWAGHLAAFWLVQQLPFGLMFAIGTSLPTSIPALFAFFVVVLVGSLQNWAIRRAYLRNFAKLGIPTEVDALYEILPEGLRLTTDRITLLPKWQTIDSIEPSKGGWVLSADHLTFFIPRERFADRAAERAFMAGLVDRLSDKARERSGEVVKFVAPSAD